MQPQFLPAGPGSASRLFAVLHWPAGPVRGLVVHAPAFGEEMNKARRMVALQARALAAAGHAVLVPDLTGCGDSEGDFGQATWQGWVEDVVHACQCLRQQCRERNTSQGTPLPPLTLWGLRAGALLAAQAAAQLGDVPQLLLWQPAVAGKPLLQQFLRLAAVGDLLGGAQAGSAGTAALRQQLQAGTAVEVAGYTVHPALAQGLEAARLEPVAGVRQLAWLECSPREEVTLSPAAAAPLAAWRGAGCAVQAQAVQGPAFWQTTEIEDAPALIQATLNQVWGQVLTFNSGVRS
ncbi:MAG: hydrolase 2, exosortase A system-associated [Betaproteobacteria bacterium]|nr:hydrolase 2, exosortase A system-associated [Betaproteobacteria bacterium]